MTAAERQRRRRQRMRAERRFEGKRKRQGKRIEPKASAGTQADRIVGTIARALKNNPQLNIDDIRAAIDRKWQKASALPAIREGRSGEAPRSAVLADDEKIRQDADAYRLEQAKAILRALGQSENDDGTFGPPATR